MTARTLTVEHDGTTYHGHAAVIKSTSLTYEDHGILTAYVACEWPSAGITVGGYCLDKSTGSPDYKRVGTAYGLDHIIRLLDVVGVHSWEAMAGKQVIVLFSEANTLGRQAVGLAHITDESKVFILSEHAEQWRLDHDGEE